MIPVKLSDGGRVVIPVEIRDALGLKEGDTVLWEIKDGRAQLTAETGLTAKALRIRQAQAIVRRHVAPGESLVDELIAQRREEASRE